MAGKRTPSEPPHPEKFGGTAYVVDSTTEVLLDRMQGIAGAVGVVSLLVALPMLWMAWVLGANLAGLLMLNERRTLGLLRLRGIAGARDRARADRERGRRRHRRAARWGSCSDRSRRC